MSDSPRGPAPPEPDPPDDLDVVMEAFRAAFGYRMNLSPEEHRLWNDALRAARGGSSAGEPTEDLAERLGDKLCAEYDLRVSNSEAADLIAFVRASSGGSAGAATEAHPSRDALLVFSRKVIKAAIEGMDVDGGDVQDWAIEAGLLVATEMTAPCDPDHCPCEERGDFPQTCYRFGAALSEPRNVSPKEGR
jgi:hypothetical protein